MSLREPRACARLSKGKGGLPDFWGYRQEALLVIPMTRGTANRRVGDENHHGPIHGGSSVQRYAWAPAR